MNRSQLQEICQEIRKKSDIPIDCRSSNEDLTRYIQTYYEDIDEEGFGPDDLYQALESHRLDLAETILEKFPPTKVPYDATKLTKMLIRNSFHPEVIAFILKEFPPDSFQYNMNIISLSIVNAWDLYFIQNNPEYLEIAKKWLYYFGTQDLFSELITDEVFNHVDNPAIMEMVNQYLPPDQFHYDKHILTERLIIAMKHYIKGFSKTSEDFIEKILDFFGYYQYNMFEIAEMLGQYLSKGNQSAAEFILNYFPPSTFREHMEPIYEALKSTLISNHLDEAQLFLKYFSMSRLSGYQLDEFKKILLRDLILSEHHYVTAIKACLGIDVFEPQVFRGIVYSIDPPDKYLPIETAEFILQNFPLITFGMFEIQDLTNNFINMLSPTPLYEFYTVKFKDPDALASEIQECSQRYTDKVFQAIFPTYLNPKTFSYDNLTISKRFIRAVKDNNLRLAQRILDYFPPSRTDYENHAVAFLFSEVLRKKNLLAAKFLWDHFSTMILHSKYLGDLTDVLVNSLKNGHQFEVAKFILSHFHAVKLPDPLRKIGKALAQTNDPEIGALLKSNVNRPY